MICQTVIQNIILLNRWRVGWRGDLSLNKSDKNPHTGSQLNVYEIFISGKSHMRHKIQESKMFQNLKGLLLGRKMIKVHGYICGHFYLEENVIGEVLFV